MSWGREGLFPCLCSWSFMRLHIRSEVGGGRGIQRSQDPTSMTNSNPSRFFISSTKYLGERVRNTWREGRGKETGETDRGPRKAVESGRERNVGPPCLPSESKGLVDAPLQPLPTLRLPHEPQLQTVHTAATLHHLVSGVQSHIVELVLLEEVAGLGPMATLEQVLWGRSCQPSEVLLGHSLATFLLPGVRQPETAASQPRPLSGSPPTPKLFPNPAQDPSDRKYKIETLSVP